MARPSADELSSVLAAVVDRHMRDHPDLQATADAVTALQELIATAAQRLAQDAFVNDPRAVGVASTEVLMEAIEDAAQQAPGTADPPGTEGLRRPITRAVVSEAVARRCPVWPFRAPES